MSNMSLLEKGKIALAEIRRLDAEAKAKAEELESERRVQAWAKVLEPLYAALPAELHGHVNYDSTDMPTWPGRVWIDAIQGCRIGVSDNSGTLHFYPQVAVQVVRNYYGNGRATDEFCVEYNNSPYDGFADPLAAIAHAAELAPANLVMEADAKAQGEAAAAKEAIVVPTESELIHAMIYDGKPVEAIARALLLIAKLLEDR